MRDTQRIKIGSIGKGHGLKGAFYLGGRTELLPAEIKTLIIDDNASGISSLTLEWQKAMGGGVVVKCKELVSRSDVDAQRRKSLYVLRCWLDVKEDDEYCWADLIGKQIIDMEGSLLGAIARVDNYGAGDVITIQETGGDRTLAIPFIRDYVDMSFVSMDMQIKLTVMKETFDGCWQE